MSVKKFLSKLHLAEKLFDLHEDAFKAKNYRNWAYQIEQLEGRNIIEMSEAELSALGLSTSLLKRLKDFKTLNSFPELDFILEKTPEGVTDMLSVKGLGAKKTRVLWKDAGISDLESLKIACEKGEIAKIKGFGEKTQSQILENIQFKASQTGYFLLDTSLQYGLYLLQKIKEIPEVEKAELCGTLARYSPLNERIEVLFSAQNKNEVFQKITHIEGIEVGKKVSTFSLQGNFEDNYMPFSIHFCRPEHFESELFYLTSSPSHLSFSASNGDSLGKIALRNRNFSVKEIYEKVSLPLLPAHLREDRHFITPALIENIPQLIAKEDIKGIMHAHSTYSDGANSLREMSLACIQSGFSYLGITEHSQSATYARGLKPEDVLRQHDEIDRLNEELAPFRILKGIESDILSDGNLDYPDEILSKFDFIIASVHSGLSMSEEKATERIIKAAMNPYTHILGHLTGRLLLKREGYPLDIKAVIDTCAEFRTAIEINANPYRLDLDWRNVHYALSKGVQIVISPDAHNVQDISHFAYGIHIGIKGGLTKKMTLNARSAEEILKYFASKNQFA
jgi:DNA polymerase (family 10)